jgi:hypothetical protein
MTEYANFLLCNPLTARGSFKLVITNSEDLGSWRALGSGDRGSMGFRRLLSLKKIKRKTRSGDTRQ